MHEDSDKVASTSKATGTNKSDIGDTSPSTNIARLETPTVRRTPLPTRSTMRTRNVVNPPRALWFSALVCIGVLIHLSSAQSPRLKRKPESVSVPLEYKAIEFAPGTDANTESLNRLAADRWEFVGLLHPGNLANPNSTVVFRRVRNLYPAEFRR